MKICGQHLKERILHPFLLTVYPILFLYSHNIKELRLATVAIPMLITLTATLCIYFLLTLIIKNRLKKGIFLSLIIFMVFSYGHMQTLVTATEKNPTFLILYLFGFLISCFFLLKSKKTFQSTNFILNLITIFLLVFSSLNIIIYEFRFRPNKVPDTEQHSVNLESDSQTDPARYPDIYYLIFDRYGSSSLLAEKFGYDNSPFDNYLQEKGFYIASQSKANYPYTFLSLASSLNLRYLDFLRPATGKTSDKTVAYRLIKDSTVVKFLKSKGYRFYNFGSWWQPTQKNPRADKNIFLNGLNFFNLNLNEFNEKLLKTTFIYHLLTDLFGASLIDPEIDLKRIIYQFEELEKIVKKQGPKYIFSHSLSTHPPFFFDSQGNTIAHQERAKRSLKELYIKSIAFTNNRIRKIVDAILSQANRPTVIIIQADEGPDADILADAKVSRNLFRRSNLRASIFNAFFVSPECRKQLYDHISPVNTFRLIFNHYFQTRLPLLEDRVFLTLRERDMYQFTEITHRLIYGTIVLKNIPHPVRIFLDGKEIKQIDKHKIRNVKPGFHSIKILKQGFEPWQAEVEVKATSPSEILVNLRATIK